MTQRYTDKSVNKFEFLFKNHVVFILFFLITFSLLSFTINKPYFWDDLCFYAPCAEKIIENNFNPFVCNVIGRPPLFFMTLAIAFKVFGSSILVSHVLILVFVSITLYFTYLTLSIFLSRNKSFVITLVMFFSPLFFSTSGILLIDVPLTTFTITTLYFFLKSKKICYLISGSILVLIKEPGVFCIISIIIFVFLKGLFFKVKFKELFKEITYYSLPILVLLLWLLITYGYHKKIYDPGHISALSINKNEILGLYNKKMYEIFSKDYKFLILFIITFSIILEIVKKHNNYFILIILLPSLIFLFLYKELFYLSWIVGIYIIILLMRKVILFEEILFFNIIIIYSTFFGFYSWDLPRYLLPVYPSLFIILGIKLNSIFKRYIFFLIICSLFVLLFISNYFDSSDSSIGYEVEDNLEYIDFIQVRKDATNFIETYYPNSIVLTSWWDTGFELSNPNYGYVRKPIKVSIMESHDFGKRDFDLIYYAPFISKDYLNKYLSYYNLTLLKRFEKNGKYTEIYTFNN